MIIKRDKYLDIAWELKNYGPWKWLIPLVIGLLGIGTKGLLQELEDLEIRRRMETIAEIGQNTEMSHRVLRRLAVSQTHVKKYRQTLVRESFQKSSHQRLGKRTRGLGNKRTSGDNPNYSIADISQNAEKSPGELRRHSDSSEKLSANADVKNSQGVKTIITWHSSPDFSLLFGH